MEFNFKKGIYPLNPQSNYDFQLNRLVMWDGGDLEEIKAVGQKISSSESWKRELITLGDKAVRENRLENAIGYYRMSEFFMYDGDPDKTKYYEKASKMFYAFYQSLFESGTVERFFVPYEEVKLPVLHAKAKGEQKDTILLHGGNDSYLEEFFMPMLYLAENGFEVYLFEGPGQGSVVRIQNKHFTYKWEEPVNAILNYFHLNDVTIIGASLGGMLAPRAAAFEPRISRVIAWSVFPNFQDVLLHNLPPEKRGIFRLCLKMKLRPLLNAALKKAARTDEMVHWGLAHGMYAYEAKTPYEYVCKMNDYQMMNVADRITQDVFIAGASEDHFIDYTAVGAEIASLRHARSVTFRLFTKPESACNHCNCGNVKLTFDTFMNWINLMKSPDRAIRE